jgi:hypothetical protein
MNFGQTNIVKSVHPLPPSSKRTHQGPIELVLKWGRKSKVGSISHLLGPLGQGLVLCGLPGQWTPVVTHMLMNFHFRSLEKLQIVLQVPEIK